MHKIKPFLILQLRPEDEAADGEFNAFLQFGGLKESDVHRVRMERDGLPDVNLNDYSGVIVGGGPSNISDAVEKKSDEQKEYEPKLLALLKEIVARDTPYLGACYGLGALAAALGAPVSKEKYGEAAGPVTITLQEAGKTDPLLQGVVSSFRAFCGHKEAVQEVPDGAVLLASSDTCPIQMIRIKQNVYAVQFHTELDVDGIEVRIRIYKHCGYFEPSEAEPLMALCAKENVTEPMKILANFVSRYSQPL